MKLNQLKNIYIQPTRLIKLRFRYRIANSQVKVLCFTLNIKYVQAGQLNVYDFIESIMEDVLSSFILLQSESVQWETLSITYPLKRGPKCDLLKLPLFGLKGAVSNKEPNSLGKVLHISIRFEGRPLPTNVKVYGIHPNESEINKDLVDSCSYIYTNNFFIKNTGITYNLVFPPQKKQKISDLLVPIMAFSNIK